MGESWFHREFLNGRRLAFNVLFYGLQLFLFAYGWYTQVKPFNRSDMYLRPQSDFWIVLLTGDQ